MRWNLDQLEAFVTSVEAGSFSAAARKLGKAQSRISTAIANLEADLGFELFNRQARLPVLTPAGEEMYVEAQVVLVQCQRLQARAMTVLGGNEASLTIAMDEAMPIEPFEYFFQEVAKQFPLLKLTVLNGSQDDIAEWVETQQADLGILFHLSLLPDSLEFMQIGQITHSLIVSSTHPLASIAAPTVADLNQYRQLVIRGRMGKRQTKAVSSEYWYIDSYYHITSLVIKGIGWALVPEHVANIEWYSNASVKLSTQNIPGSFSVAMGVVKRRDRGCGQIMDWMLSEINTMFRQP
ncbi:LysR family transcriptional regulator [Spartinivicinus poritis]|uniref:LysR family transcriptional regulator n=1 Tax=Spartinivicinus poritis TaxID=2994640 RepID=A0ABT5UCP2_9GAMM|nr:LysR family transcriptional regulator [Spartinivicinus sp. A2-2]MDE1464153.1 LysR family transcriptional regulator [Spartinivicinus sp. A2-2]